MATVSKLKENNQEDIKKIPFITKKQVLDEWKKIKPLVPGLLLSIAVVFIFYIGWTMCETRMKEKQEMELRYAVAIQKIVIDNKQYIIQENIFPKK